MTSVYTIASRLLVVTMLVLHLPLSQAVFTVDAMAEEEHHTAKGVQPHATPCLAQHKGERQIVPPADAQQLPESDYVDRVFRPPKYRG